MYDNQFILADFNLDNFCDLAEASFDRLNMYTHRKLPVFSSSNPPVSILLLGYILNPWKPAESNQEIVRNLVNACPTKESFFRAVQVLSGRFVLLYRNGSDFVALNDACALRQLYYGILPDKTFLTSSPRMFLDFYGKEWQISARKKEFINLKGFEDENECAWYGDKGIEDRLKKVLPNHYLDIAGKEVHRLPVSTADLISERDIVEYTSGLLKGSIEAITRRYRVIQPLTAGWDSRNILAAGRDFKEEIQYFIFDFATEGEEVPDVWVPRNLSSKLGLNFQVWKPGPLREDFKNIYQREHVNPRMLKAIDIQYLYDKYRDTNTVRMSGVAGAIFKSFYGYSKRKVSAEMLRYFTFYLDKCEFLDQEVHSWYSTGKSFADEHGIPVQDLFHWENKTGNWGALYAFEQDIAVEEFCPHSNRNFLLSILKVEPQKRSSPKCLFILKLVDNLWPEVLSEPINPIGLFKKIKKNIKKDSILKYNYLKALAMLRSK